MKKLLPFLLIAAALPSCRRTPDLSSLSTNFVVITNRDSLAVFSNYKTYYISDTLAYLSDTQNDSILVGPPADSIVKALETNMAARGYTEVPKGANPDLGFNVGVVKNLYVAVSYPGWWWGYPGWYPPYYWGWYWPYYYPWSIYYTVTTGTVIVDLVDLKDANADHKLNVLWNAFMGGAVGSDVNANIHRGVTAIDQAFVQSPYLKAQ